MSNIFDQLAQNIGKLPGIGPKMAKRIALHLVQHKGTSLHNLVEAINKAKNCLFECENCSNIDQEHICGICTNQNRDHSTICIVEQVADLWAIEKARNYRGIYHILGGNLSAIGGKDFNSLNLDKLYQRISQSGKIQEVIIATSATIDGQTTAYFIAENLKEFANIRTTRLAYGIPIGSELDYLDEGTIAIALKTRSLF